MKLIYTYAFVLLLVACGTKKDVKPVITVNESNTATEQVTDIKETPSERPVYQPTRTVKTDLVHTKLEVSFDWNLSRMNGSASITAKQHFYPSDSLILDAKGMDLNSITMNGKKLTYSYDSLQLRILLDRVYSKDETFTVKIDYVAKPDERKTGGSAAITSDKGLYFINPKGEEKSKMPQIWTQGETEANSVWFPTIDSPNSKSTEELFITVADKFTTLSNGKLMSSVKNPNGTRTDRWKQDLPHAPYLFMMAVGEFKVIKDTYTRPDGTEMEVNYYVEPEWESTAKAIFGETPAMIKYFSNLLGVEYPWDKYHQIVVRDYVSGAMENTGAVIFGDFVYKTKRELLDSDDQSTIAHELFHHWFGDLVTAESWSNLTLNESFANYSQYLWDEFRYGLDEAAYQAEKEADGYFQSAQAQGYHNLVWFDYDTREQMFDGHSYNKGGRILHMLRSYIGDEAFFAGIKNYLSTNKFKSAEFHQLRLAMEEVSGEDLNWFFNQWYLASGHPILDIKQTVNSENNTVKISIKQSQNLETFPIFKLPMEIAIYDDAGTHSHKVIAEKLESEFELPFTGTLKCVMVDNQQMLLAKIREEKPTDQYVYQYYNTKQFKARRDGLMLGTIGSSIASEQLILDALKDDFWNIRSLAIEKAVKLKDSSAKLKAVELISEMAKADSKSSVRAAALNFLGTNLEQEKGESLMVDRITNDSSYLVISAALRNLGKTNPELAMSSARELEKENSSKMLAGIGQLYSAHAGPEAFTFFENALKGDVLQGFDQLGMMNSFTMFVVKQDIDFLEKAYLVYENLGETGGFYTKMFLPQNATYIVGNLENKTTELNDEIASHDKNNDAAYASSARKTLKRYEALLVSFKSLEKKKDEEVQH
jgi:aminopeptidase N